MNRPLTIDELKALNVGDWVWVVDKDYKEGYYAQISYQEISAVTIDSNIGGLEEIYDSDYGTKWLAYKNKEQAECKGEIVELPCIRTIERRAGKLYEVVYVQIGGMIGSETYPNKTNAERRLAELRGEK